MSVCIDHDERQGVRNVPVPYFFRVFLKCKLFLLIWTIDTVCGGIKYLTDWIYFSISTLLCPQSGVLRILYSRYNDSAAVWSTTIDHMILLELCNNYGSFSCLSWESWHMFTWLSFCSSLRHSTNLAEIWRLFRLSFGVLWTEIPNMSETWWMESDYSVFEDKFTLDPHLHQFLLVDGHTTDEFEKPQKNCVLPPFYPPKVTFNS